MLQHYDDRNRDLIVNIGGELVHRDQAGVSPFDSTVQNGDAVWEGLRVYEGRIFRLRAHLDRMRRGAERLAYAGIPPADDIRREIQRTLDANGMRDGVHIRLTLSRGLKYTSGLDPRVNTNGCMLIVLAEHKAPVYDKTGLSLITSSWRRPNEHVLDQKIHSCNQLTSILAKIEANAAGADDAMLLDSNGCIAETNATHLFFVIDGVVCTPTTTHCPEGITRDAVLGLCHSNDIASEIRDIRPDELPGATECFCTGTMGEIASVLQIDGRSVGDGRIGPMTNRISDLFSALAQSEAEPIVASS